MNSVFDSLLEKKRFLVIDGALATELQTRGCHLNDALWSAKILVEQPHMIQQIHEDYYRAGADIAITSSYQASTQGLMQGGLDEENAQNFIKLSVKLARNARCKIQNSDADRQMLIAGSVGPYGAFLADGSEYRGGYQLSHADLTNFHRSRVEALVTSGVDLLAFETLPSALESCALLDLLRAYPTTQAWFSFTLRDSYSISDGTLLETVIQALNASPQVVAIGVNCVSTELVAPSLAHMSRLTNKPLLAYPNSGETWDPETNTWSGKTDTTRELASYVSEWLSKGAQLLGGCCRTTPTDIKSISEQVHRG